MQYILDANRAAQEKLKGSNPKELYIPFNAGRRTGIKSKANQDNVFSTAPSADSIKLTEWIGSRLNDGSITTPDLRPYYVYAVKLTQTSTSAPVATVLENTFPAGTVITFTRQDVGVYRMRATGLMETGAGQPRWAVISGKTNNIGPDFTLTQRRVEHDEYPAGNWGLGITTYNNSAVAADGQLSNYFIEYRYYPQ